ncbi:unnamed protein product [Leptidea sinapis]|uniref:UDP-glucuronosyltransferase n=1 Tax=Leptidea sinapis TaxID=189913 RepID=A0A5E4QSM0_9NEOP|nr:unnamed protein product [Leptidea sinapis]
MCKTNFVLLFTFTTNVISLRILAVFPTTSVSHQIVFRPLTQELAHRGHEVTVITTDPVFPPGKSPKNLREIDVHNISYGVYTENIVDKNFARSDIIVDQFDHIDGLNAKIVQMQLFTEEIRDLVTDNESAKFDLLLLEMCARASLIYSYLFDAPVIQISSFGMWTDIDKTIGAPTHPLLFPNLFHQKLYDLSFWEKLYEIYKDWIIKYNSLILESIEMRDFLNLFGNQIPNYDILRKNVHMLSINSHPIWYDSQPLPLNLISMWGIHNKTQKILPQELKTYLDSCKRGVIYISFGTNVKWLQLPQEKFEIFKEVLSNSQYDVLWKWDNDNFPILSGNIKMSKWFPQSDILRHPNVKLFISQGGLQSIEEAVHAGVPVIGIPMFIDQWYNVEKIRHHKIGIRLDMDTLDQQKLNESIHTFLNDARFQNNILRFRSLLSDQPHSGLDRAVWWTEYVLHHGGSKHLEAPSAHISWVEYYDVQLISTLIGVSVSFIVIIYCFIAKNFSFMLFSD